MKKTIIALFCLTGAPVVLTMEQQESVQSCWELLPLEMRYAAFQPLATGKPQKAIRQLVNNQLVCRDFNADIGTSPALHEAIARFYAENRSPAERAFLQACKSGSENVVKAFLTLDLDKALLTNGLEYAIEYGHMNIFNLLSSNGTQVTAIKSPHSFIEAAKKGYKDIFEKIITTKNISSEKLINNLHEGMYAAARIQQQNTLHFLVENIEKYQLFRAILLRDKEHVKYLLENGEYNKREKSDPVTHYKASEKTINCPFAAYLAGITGDISIIELVFEHCYPDYDYNGTVEALDGGHQHVLEYFFNLRNNYAIFPYGELFLAACRNNYQDIAEAVLDVIHEKQNDLEFVVTELGHDALLAVANTGHDAIAHMLIEKFKSLFMSPPLHEAAQNGYVEVIKVLLDNDANINSWGANMQTALHHAVVNEHKEAVELLVNSGADLTKKTLRGLTPLMIAAQKGYKYITKLLLKHMLTLDDGDNSRMTALMHAARNGNLQIVKLLVSAHADMNQTDRDEKTALSHALEKGFLPIANWLLENNARVFDHDLVIADKLNNQRLSELLQARFNSQ